MFTHPVRRGFHDLYREWGKKFARGFAKHRRRAKRHANRQYRRWWTRALVRGDEYPYPLDRFNHSLDEWYY